MTDDNSMTYGSATTGAAVDAANSDVPEPQAGALRRLWRRLGTTDEEIEAAELQASSRSVGATSIDSCNCGDMVTVCGPLRSVTMKPAESVPTVEAEVYDGSGRVVLVWLGRRHIQGIEPGRVLTATGRVNTVDGRRTIYNPRYSLRAMAAGE